MGTAKAQALRIGATYGLGSHTSTFAQGSRLRNRVKAGWTLISIAVIGGICLVVAWHQETAVQHYPPPTAQDVTHAGELVALGVAIGVILLVPPRRTPPWYWHYYEGGVATVSDRGRVTAVRLADVVSMSTTVVAGYDESFVAGSALTDHAGNTVSVSHRHDLADRAEQILLDRHLGPLIARFDAGQPVAIGCLTMGKRGITCRSRRPKGHWDVTWPEVSNVVTRLHGQRVTVTRHQGRKPGMVWAALDDEPNGFLAGYLLRHAARQAGVPFQADEPLPSYFPPADAPDARARRMA